MFSVVNDLLELSGAYNRLVGIAIIVRPCFLLDDLYDNARV